MQKRNFGSKDKFKIVMESFQKENVAEVARKYGVNANLISKWQETRKISQ